MYCKMCGNLLEDADINCKICGAEVERKAKPVEVETEEIVYNPSYEEPKKEFEEKVAESAFGQEPKIVFEIQENNPKTMGEFEKKEEASKIHREFEWNVHDFPKTKKTEDAVFIWDPTLYKSEESTGIPLEQQLFREINEDNVRNHENLDKFFTFSKKNEEFQELLDKEYEKLRMRSDKNYINREDKTKLELQPITASTLEPEPESVIAAPVQFESNPADIKVETEAKPQFVLESQVEEKIETISAGQNPQPEMPLHRGSSQIEEMAAARANFFCDDILQDNDTIKKKYGTIEAAIKEPKSSEQVLAAPENQISNLEDAKVLEEERLDIPAEETKSDHSEAAMIPPISPPSDIEGQAAEKEKKKGYLGKGLLILIAVILLIEIAVLGIRYFAPESAAAEYIGETQTKVVGVIAGWVDNMKDLFSGGDSNNPAGPKEPTDSTKDPDGNKPEDIETVVKTPDPAPVADKSVLVSSQLYRNTNIEKVKANDSLAYNPSKDYGVDDLNKSEPIANNIWLTPEGGDVVYYDASIVGTLIAFDSQWIDYVNGGSSKVLELVKKDSKAYQNAVSFSKVGKVKETFKLLEIGEIRQGANGFYAWVHEEIQLTENGVTAEIKYNWIYYLEPIDNQLKIVNYFKF